MRTAVQLHEPACQRQAEPGAFLLGLVIAADLAKLLEHLFLVFRRDADAGVADGNFETALRPRARASRDASAVRRELDGIGQQIDQDLLELALVGA